MSFNSCALSKDKLPTRLDIMNHILFLRSVDLEKGKPVRTSHKDYCGKVVIDDVFELWMKLKIPTVSKQTARHKLLSIVNEHKKVIKTPSLFNAVSWGQLFWVSYCKCRIQNNVPCTCDEKKKIPPEAKDFIIDQCTTRLLSFESSEEENQDSEMYDFSADVVGTVSDYENQFLIDLDVDDDSSSSGESERNEESENDIEMQETIESPRGMASASTRDFLLSRVVGT